MTAAAQLGSTLTCLRAQYVLNILIRPQIEIAEKYSISYPFLTEQGHKSCSEKKKKKQGAVLK